ncbi:hypothetical protein HPG69_006896 [Diceros bicornis minor]|uniref:Methylated-DNA--protein-cysteine methyltransferase n=1 Tax=Diceros bicornis minor TaxID=77932 RepID=A0A7J7F3E6_DICBM|nr:hypothetical protein HPG69_006896 [Diceros bicornis minor]
MAVQRALMMREETEARGRKQLIQETGAWCLPRPLAGSSCPAPGCGVCIGLPCQSCTWLCQPKCTRAGCPDLRSPHDMKRAHLSITTATIIMINSLISRPFLKKSQTKSHFASLAPSVISVLWTHCGTPLLPTEAFPLLSASGTPTPRGPSAPPWGTPLHVQCSRAVHPLWKDNTFIHQTGVMEAAEGCEIRRSGFLPTVSSPSRQPQSRAGSGRSNEKQSCKFLSAWVPILIPCHRVVCSSGAVGNYSGGLGVKEWLLAHEGSLVERPSRGGGSRLARSWRGALGGTTSSQAAGRN